MTVENLSKIIKSILSNDNAETVEGLRLLKDLYKNSFDANLVEQIQAAGETQTYKGSATEPMNAITCFDDVLRTSKFMKGVCKAVDKLLKDFPEEQVNILYAGCGPLAPLVLPLCSLWNPERVKLTLMDVYRPSLDFAVSIASAWGLEDYIARTVCEDAAFYKFPAEEKLHLVVTETMSAALEGEGQVAVSFNLYNQLTDGGIFIPEEVNVNAMLMNPPAEFEYVKSIRTEIISKGGIEKEELERFRNGGINIIKLNSETIKLWRQFYGDDIKQLPRTLAEKTYDMTEKPEKKYQLMLTTDLVIYDDIKLNEYESGITHPRAIFINEPYDVIKSIKFYYDFSDAPKIKYSPLVEADEWF